MSFGSPLLLVALALLPLAVLAYLRADGKRRRAAAAFTTSALLPAVAPVRPGWRRHVPIAVYGVALAGLTLALARPEISIAVPEQQASVVLVTDESGSMEATDLAPSRLEVAREAAHVFLDDVPAELRVGAVAFNHRVRAVERPSTERADVRALVDELEASGGTATGEALAAALRVLREPPAAVVLLSDGESTNGRDPVAVAREAAEREIPVYTVALGTDEGTIEVEHPQGEIERVAVPPDRDSLRRIAAISGGEFYEADDAGELNAVYERLGSRIGERIDQREVTAAFAAGGALLLLVGGALSLRWFGRLP